MQLKITPSIQLQYYIFIKSLIWKIIRTSLHLRELQKCLAYKSTVVKKINRASPILIGKGEKVSENIAQCSWSRIFLCLNHIYVFALYTALATQISPHSLCGSINLLFLSIFIYFSYYLAFLTDCSGTPIYCVLKQVCTSFLNQDIFWGKNLKSVIKFYHSFKKVLKLITFFFNFLWKTIHIHNCKLKHDVCLV